jgi:SAM-dependent methyltransferase
MKLEIRNIRLLKWLFGRPRFTHLRVCVRIYGLTGIYHFFLESFYLRRLNHALPIKLNAHALTTLIDWRNWCKYYLPPTSLRRDDLILDAGAGEGETLFFYYRLGFRNFRAVEPDKQMIRLLSQNITKMPGIHVEIINDCLKPEHLVHVSFAKVDCEGGEKELFGLDHLPFTVVEAHSKKLCKRFKALGFVELEISDSNRIMILRNFDIDKIERG